MKKFLLAGLASLFLIYPVLAQYTNVTYDFDRNWFNEGQALPAEQSIIIKGLVPKETQLVELAILSAKRGDELYRADWYRSGSNEMMMMVPFKLRASNTYDIGLYFFNDLSSAKKNKISQQIKNTFNAYMEVNLSGDKSIKLAKNSKKILRELNEIVENTLSEYRSKRKEWKPEFSEIVRLKLQQIEKADLDKDFDKNAGNSKQTVRSDARQDWIQQLKVQIDREVDQFFDEELLVLTHSRYIDNYATEEKVNSIAFNIGYGGVYLSGNWDDFTYGSSPYLGLSFPLGNSVLGSKLLSNTSITLGVFLNNFEDENQNEVTGLIVDRPIYLGLDHKLFKFIRINAGAAFLEGQPGAGSGQSDNNNKNIMIRPYVGLSARIDLSINLGK